MTKKNLSAQLARLCAVALIGTSVSACNVFQRLADIGKTPELSEIQNPTQAANYRPVSMPMPTPVTATRQANSLWVEGSRAFFEDQRASEVGDIITVVVEIADDAAIDNRTRHDRTHTDNMDVNGLFGIENWFNEVFPEPVADPLVGLSSSTANDGRGRIDRNETINLRLAAVVTQELPNGNMVLFGRQEVRVNFEVREVVVGGVIRPEDIASDNTVNYDEMAEARIAYGGRGQISDLQQQRYGAQALEILMPF
ncbi:flagellar basal body L-ring protein FlgH [Nisaea acidiphila]|uniref:Flagellar L-ring protein n=1 Tax=Nisaea acidiphila TaxID=1862145 RepID=A0A9J7AT36_9PROT|nr:flagellar basal body L-ring protein FlgH [Nisaea acidiphila]UUX50488.1 flagellar basal body L-ring protein FlgH [Nisaea acidiphila]